jgi:hypothetical protein
MDDLELLKEFMKKWARYTTILANLELKVLDELNGEPMARTQAQMIFSTMMPSDQDCREVALRLALVDFQLMLKSP